MIIKLYIYFLIQTKICFNLKYQKKAIFALSSL
jgi:hypothetical protein